MVQGGQAGRAFIEAQKNFGGRYIVLSGVEGGLPGVKIREQPDVLDNPTPMML